MKYVGVCFDSGAWGRDLTGLLVVEETDGWKVAGSHISSNASWAEHDIRGHFDRRLEPSEEDTFEWAGQLAPTELETRFGWLVDG